MPDIPLRTLRMPEIGIVQINNPVTEQLALDFCQELDTLYGYYCYESVLVRIHSPGGQIQALDYMLETIARWRTRGRTLQTQATMQAISAAALLLSLGEVGHRSASPCSALLYHHTRFVSPSAQTITAAAAMGAAQQLVESDLRLMRQLCNHLVHGFGGTAGFARTGLDRLSQSRSSPTSEAGKSLPSWQDQIQSVYEEVARTGHIEAFQKHLMQRFDEDRVMTPREAQDLMLIDLLGVDTIARH